MVPMPELVPLLMSAAPIQAAMSSPGDLATSASEAPLYLQVIAGVGVLAGTVVGAAYLFWKNFKFPPKPPAALVVEQASFADLAVFREISAFAKECAEYLKDIRITNAKITENQSKMLELLEQRDERDRIQEEATKLAKQMVEDERRREERRRSS